MFSRPLGSGFRHRELSRFLFRDFFFSSSRCGEGFSFQADTYRCSLDSPPPPSSTRTTEKGKSQRLEFRQKALGFPHRPSPRQVGAASREAARGGRAGAFVQQSIRSRNSEKKSDFSLHFAMISVSFQRRGNAIFSLPSLETGKALGAFSWRKRNASAARSSAGAPRSERGRRCPGPARVRGARRSAAVEEPRGAGGSACPGGQWG